MKSIFELEEKLHLTFKNKDILLQALTHRSYLNENASSVVGHNERLEFLGDAVLELVVTEALYKEFPDKPEGELTALRAALVNADMLSHVGTSLELNNFVLLSRGEAKDEGRARKYILANAFEALIGAIYLDQGYESAKNFIARALLPNLVTVFEKKLYKDSKSLFQEEAQERVKITPTYEVLEESGPDHDRRFVVGIYLGKELIAQGEGPSKQAGQEEAAKNALIKKKWI